MTSNSNSRFRVDYGRDVEQEIDRLLAAITTSGFETNGYPSRWLALKLLENDIEIVAQTRALTGGPALLGTRGRAGGVAAGDLP